MKIQDNRYGGTCACGCGKKTNINRHDDPITGRKAGQHKMFVAGHYHLLLRQLNGPTYGQQMRRRELREKRLREIIGAILETDGTVSLQEIGEDVAPEFSLQGVSRMVNHARDYRWDLRVPHIIVRRPKKQFIPYERPEIPYERETELPMLVNQRRSLALDAPRAEDEESYHSVIPCGNLNPLEMLMLKEEMESEEFQDRQQRIRAWDDWHERKRPLVSLSAILQA